ncbi:hypothetical protein EDB86DRAFT_2894126 [Lactarius hatsudake]|nr:hypothetical protein EDB86DRAFT_2894126 [Lactarius hatsudake]
MLSLNYATHAYLALLLTQSSSLLADPSAAGQLPDIHLFSVPKTTWEHSSAAIISALRQTDGVLKVEIQEPRVRAKRGQLYTLNPDVCANLSTFSQISTTFEGHPLVRWPFPSLFSLRVYRSFSCPSLSKCTVLEYH